VSDKRTQSEVVKSIQSLAGQDLSFNSRRDQQAVIQLMRDADRLIGLLNEARTQSHCHIPGCLIHAAPPAETKEPR
jgi:hypothetical protein